MQWRETVLKHSYSLTKCLTQRMPLCDHADVPFLLRQCKTRGVHRETRTLNQHTTYKTALYGSQVAYFWDLAVRHAVLRSMPWNSSMDRAQKERF